MSVKNTTRKHKSGKACINLHTLYFLLNCPISFGLHGSHLPTQAHLLQNSPAAREKEQKLRNMLI